MKKTISILCAIIFACFCAFPSFALDTSVSAQINEIDVQMEEIEENPNYNENFKTAAEEKATRLKALLSGQIQSNSRSESHLNYVPFYEQDDDYLCSAASIQQTIGGYLYPESMMESQTEIYDQVYGDSNEMKNYLNNFLNPNSEPGYIYYSVWWNSSNKNMKSTITSTVIGGTPIIVHVLPITSNGQRTSYTDTSKWPYLNPSSGHYMSISGYKNNGNIIQLTDPYITWTAVGQTDPGYSGGKYDVNYSILNPVADRLII